MAVATLTYPVKLCIFGSRNYWPTIQTIDNDILAMGLQEDLDCKNIEVVCGLAEGVDISGRQWANSKGLQSILFRPDWGKHGKAAGPIRNFAMAKYCTHGLGYWLAESRGTANMAAQLVSLNKPVRLIKLNPRDTI